MAKRKYDVVATTGTYQDKQTGQTKYINRNVGAVIQNDKGFSLALDASFNPAGCPKRDDGKVWLALFEPRQDNGGQQQQDQGPPPGDDSDVPF